MVEADGRTALIFASERSGSDGIGRPAGMAGKREPIVSTGRFSSATAIELATTAIRKPGKRGANLRSATMIARALAPTPMVAQLALGSAPRYACHLGRKSAGTLSIARQRKSFTWLEAMITAIPAVKQVDRKSDGKGKSVAVSVDLVGGSIIK